MFGLLFLDFKIRYLLWFVLGSIDATGRVPHRSPIWGAANDAAARASVPRLRFFFFFLQIRTEPGQFGQNQVVLTESNCIGRWPKQAKIGLESCRNSRNWFWMRPKQLTSFMFSFLLCFLPLKIYLKWKG